MLILHKKVLLCAAIFTNLRFTKEFIHNDLAFTMLSIGACLMAEVYEGRQQANAHTCTALIENTLLLKIINASMAASYFNNKLRAHQRPEVSKDFTRLLQI